MYDIFIRMFRFQSKIKRTPSAFLKNTYDILEKPQHSNIIQWAEDSGFVIKDQAKFQKQILPHYFKHQKYTSFVRQLNMYGFHKHRTAKNEIFFKHDKFRRGHLELTEIKRKPQFKKRNCKEDLQEPFEQDDGLDIEQNAQNSLKIEQQQKDIDVSQQQIYKEQQLESDNEINSYEENCQKLCELLIRQNKILVKKQHEFRDVIIRYKRLEIQHQKSSLETLLKINQLNHIQQQNNSYSSNASKSTMLLLQSRKRLSQSQTQEITFLSNFNKEVMSSIKELNDTNYFMFSSTSIEGGYSNIRIEESRGDKN